MFCTYSQNLASLKRSILARRALVLSVLITKDGLVVVAFKGDDRDVVTDVVVMYTTSPSVRFAEEAFEFR